ncbi:MAG: SBBP repeat-containing protein, partial [bacterium]
MGRLKNSYCFKMLKYLLLLSCIYIITISFKSNSDQPENDSASLIANAYSNIEISNDVQNWKQVNNLEFIENRGQIVDTDGNPRPDIAYVADGNGVKLYFTTTGVSYVFTMIEKSEQKNILKFDPGFRGFERNEFEDSKVTTYRMDMKLLDSNPNVKIYAEEEAEGYFNYYYAHCPDGILGVKAYKRLMYENIYDNIDLVFYDSEKGMEYDFVVKPGGKMQNVRFKYEGAEQVSLLENGKLKIINPLGQIIENAPRTYTIRNQQGITAKRIHDTRVKCFYRLERNIISFEVSDFDRNQTLIIDPELSWATYYGGSSYDGGISIATDGNGNVMITGYSDSQDFPVTSGAFQTSHADGIRDAFIVKFSISGSRQWATYYGGSNIDEALGIATDINGDNIVITGSTASPDFPVTSGAFQPNYAGYGGDAFIVKFSSSGSRQWATYCGGCFDDYGLSIATDGKGNVMITGHTVSPDFPVTSDAFQTSYAGGIRDAFIVKFSSSGSRQWATYYGGSSDDYGYSIATDGNGNMVITGFTHSPDFPVTSGAFQTNYAGYGDAFIVKFSSSG